MAKGQNSTVNNVHDTAVKEELMLYNYTKPVRAPENERLEAICRMIDMCQKAGIPVWDANDYSVAFFDGYLDAEYIGKDIQGRPLWNTMGFPWNKYGKASVQTENMILLYLRMKLRQLRSDAADMGSH